MPCAIAQVAFPKESDHPCVQETRFIKKVELSYFPLFWLQAPVQNLSTFLVLSFKKPLVNTSGKKIPVQ